MMKVNTVGSFNFTENSDITKLIFKKILNY